MSLSLQRGKQVVKKKTRSKVGGLATYSRTTAPSEVRSYFVDDSGKRWRWVVDNRMRNYGDIDYERRVIRINHAMHKGKRGALIDTIFHEELHRLFPSLGERAICALTRVLLPTLSPRYRAWLYSRIRQRQRPALNG
jgi:hypothetical protein